MKQPNLIAFAGSTRRNSFNRAVLDFAAGSARRSGAEVDLVDLGEVEIPLYQQDLEQEQGIPADVRKLKARFRDADGFLLASPEYNSSYSPLLKNVIDWCSRAESDDEPPLACYAGKSALLLSASPGPLGGMRGLQGLRALLQNIGVAVYPELLSVRSAHEAMDGDGALSDKKWQGKIDNLVKSYTAFAGKLAAES